MSPFEIQIGDVLFQIRGHILLFHSIDPSGALHLRVPDQVDLTNVRGVFMEPVDNKLRIFFAFVGLPTTESRGVLFSYDTANLLEKLTELQLAIADAKAKIT